MPYGKILGPRKDHRGVDLSSDALPFGRLWYSEPNGVSNDDAGNVIGGHEHFSNDFEITARVVKTLHYGDGVIFALPHHCP